MIWPSTRVREDGVSLMVSLVHSTPNTLWLGRRTRAPERIGGLSGTSSSSGFKCSSTCDGESLFEHRSGIVMDVIDRIVFGGRFSNGS